MALNLHAAGTKSDPARFSYNWKDVVLYALGVGAQAAELDYLYEGRGPKVLPTFAVVPSFTSLLEVVTLLDVSLKSVLHGEQKIVLHQPIPPAATLSTVSEVKGIYDKGKGALVLVECKTTDEKGQAIFDNVFSLFVRGEGGFGGDRGPEAPKVEIPTDRAPDFEVTETTSPEQALLYRLSGDLNPLHADPEFAKLSGFDRPILHGLCTFGFAGRALLQSACAGNAMRLRSFSARFAGVVFPGDTITTRGWRTEGRQFLMTTTTSDGRIVLSNVVAELNSHG
jgi:acyl dehydratase